MSPKIIVGCSAPDNDHCTELGRVHTPKGHTDRYKLYVYFLSKTIDNTDLSCFPFQFPSLTHDPNSIVNQSINENHITQIITSVTPLPLIIKKTISVEHVY